MSEQPFYHGQRSAAEQAMPPTQSNRTGIKVTWNEGIAAAIKIQHQPVVMMRKVHGMHLQPRRGQGLDAQLALNAELQMIFASRQGSRAN
jgi:hypothetical protein